MNPCRCFSFLLFPQHLTIEYEPKPSTIFTCFNASLGSHCNRLGADVRVNIVIMDVVINSKTKIERLLFSMWRNICHLSVSTSLLLKLRKLVLSFLKFSFLNCSSNLQLHLYHPWGTCMDWAVQLLWDQRSEFVFLLDQGKKFRVKPGKKDRKMYLATSQKHEADFYFSAGPRL